MFQGRVGLPCHPVYMAFDAQLADQPPEGQDLSLKPSKVCCGDYTYFYN
jgi:hypothetical protein